MPDNNQVNVSEPETQSVVSVVRAQTLTEDTLPSDAEVSHTISSEYWKVCGVISIFFLVLFIITPLISECIVRFYHNKTQPTPPKVRTIQLPDNNSGNAPAAGNLHGNTKSTQVTQVQDGEAPNSPERLFPGDAPLTLIIFSLASLVIIGATFLLKWKKYVYQIHSLCFGIPLILAPYCVFREFYILREAGIAFVVAGLVSFVFDYAYHDTNFAKPVEEIKKLVRGDTEEIQLFKQTLTDTKDIVNDLSAVSAGVRDNVHQVKTIVDRDTQAIEDFRTELVQAQEMMDKMKDASSQVQVALNDYSRMVGLVDYRRNVQSSFSEASRRILSVADYWLIDDDWWNAKDFNFDDAWTKCTLYRNLTIDTKNRGGKYPANIIFTGSVPEAKNCPSEFVPLDKMQGADLLEKPVRSLCNENTGIHFQRFLGVMWRVVVIHKVREHIEEARRKDPHAYDGYERLDVVVADIPYTVSIVDDRVWLLITRKEFYDESRGTEITDKDVNENRRTADVNAKLVQMYLHHARSAREYVESMLVFAAFPEENLSDEASVEISRQKILEYLGLEKWLEWEARDNKTHEPTLSEEGLRKAAINILTHFCATLKYLEPVEVTNADHKSNRLKIGYIRRDLY